jgi:hypothetical protein
MEESLPSNSQRNPQDGVDKSEIRRAGELISELWRKFKEIQKFLIEHVARLVFDAFIMFDWLCCRGAFRKRRWFHRVEFKSSSGCLVFEGSTKSIVYLAHFNASNWSKLEDDEVFSSQEAGE